MHDEFAMLNLAGQKGRADSEEVVAILAVEGHARPTPAWQKK